MAKSISRPSIIFKSLAKVIGPSVLLLAFPRAQLTITVETFTSLKVTVAATAFQVFDGSTFNNHTAANGGYLFSLLLAVVKQIRDSADSTNSSVLNRTSFAIPESPCEN